jgi:hypothetical protein
MAITAERSTEPLLAQQRSIRLLALVGGPVAQAIFVGGWLVAGLVQTGYKLAEEDISNLGNAATAEHRWIYNTTVSVSGFLTLALVVALARTLPRPRLKRTTAGLVALTVFAVGDLLDGVFRLDCARTAECKQRVADHLISGRHIAHGIESVFTVTALLLVPFLLRRAIAAAPRLRRLAAPTLVIAVANVAFAAAFLVVPDDAGLTQRALAFLFAAWLTAVGLLLA